MTALAQGVRQFRCLETLPSRAFLSVVAGIAPVVGAVLALRGREPSEVMFAAAFSSVLLALAWIDLQRRLVPNGIVYPALVLALAVSGAWPNRGPTDALAGGLVAFGASALVRWLSHGGLGGGDIKMAVLAGTVLGYPGAVSAGMLTAIAGGASAGALVAARRVRWDGRMPYGPAIAFGALTVLVR